MAKATAISRVGSADGLGWGKVNGEIGVEIEIGIEIEIEIDENRDSAWDAQGKRPTTAGLPKRAAVRMHNCSRSSEMAAPFPSRLSHPDPKSLPQRARWRFRPAYGGG